MNQIFQNRREAGSLLAAHLKVLSDIDRENTIILALPRGGVPVGFEVSQALDVPFDVLIVRKIGHPLQPEYGVGAIAEGGFYWIDPDAVGMSEALIPQLNNIIEEEKKEIERRVNQYRKNRSLPSLKEKTVILVDDGLATGVTARVGARYLKAKGAKKVILAIPVCSERTVNALRSEIEKIVCLNESSLFLSVGQFYRNFTQTTDEEVINLLSRSHFIKKSENLNAGFAASILQKEVVIPNEGGIRTYGYLKLPTDLKGIVIFAHGSGSGRLSPRNQQVANVLNQAGIGTLLFDLLTESESLNRMNVFDIPLLAKRLISATHWVRQQRFGKDIALGFFGASTGGGAALWAAADLKDEIKAVVSRGGRPDLAMNRLHDVEAPTLLVVGDHDFPVIPLNQKSLEHLKDAKLILIPGATHLFEEPGTLEQVSQAATEWFHKYFTEESLIESDEKNRNLEDIIEKNALPLRNSKDLGQIIEKISQAKIVMLGESSHGTQEFYEWRRLLSQELVEKHDFNLIAVEGDWPPCSTINQFIRSETAVKSAQEVLRNFKRWPTWMWANTEMIKLIEWMKDYNTKRKYEERVGFYGLDVYSLFESMDEVIHELQKIDPFLARKVRLHYECFDSFQRDEKSYAKSLAYFPEGCETQVLNALQDILKVRIDGIAKEKDQLFDAQQNARIVKNAEHYYRTMIHGDEDSWNVRDRHMLETLNILLKRYGPNSKAIVWAHNTHIGDYKATDMVQAGQINIGGLAREQWGRDSVVLLGFGTYEGEVIASHAWSGPTEIMTVPPGRSQSYEAFFHKASESLNLNSFFIWLKDVKELEFNQVLGHRAIGVVYHPAYERFGNYVPTSLANRYDGFIFIDRTEALSPLVQKFAKEEFPETWPRGV